MNRLVILAFAVCAIYTAQCSADKIKREASLSSRLLRDLKSNVHTRERRSAAKNSYIFFDNRSKRTAQLWWRDLSNPNGKWAQFRKLKPGSTIQINTFASDKWTVIDDESGVTLMVNGKEHYNPKPNTVDTRTTCIITRPGQKKANIKAFVETLVVVDKSIRDRFNSDSEVQKYVEVLLNLASNVYKHESLTQHGLKINIIASEIIVLKYEVKFDVSKGGDNVYVACDVMNKLGKNGQRFDHKLFLTRNQFGAGGYSRSSAMCSQYSSCSIVLDHGFHAAFLIAHEIAHSLGLSHGDFPQYSRYIMAGMVDGLFDNHRWSAKSQQALLINIRKYTCVSNRPSVIKKYKYPGEHYSFEKQCDLEFSEAYTAWQPSRWEPGDPCKLLKCKMPGKWYFLSKTTGSPALDGTECGENKWCLLGECQVKPSASGVVGRHL